MKRRFSRPALALSALALLITSAHALHAQTTTTLRDPALPYGSWDEAARETADAIGGRALVKPADGIYAPGDAVIYNDNGKHYRAHVISIANGRYEMHYDGFGPSWKIRADADAVLGYQPGYTPTARAASPAVAAIRRAEGGKYACNASSYNSRTGTYDFLPKGAFVLASDGSYSYLGFAQPSGGRYRVDAAGMVTFAGGHLDGGEATPIVQRPGRYYLTAPRIGERWTCGAGAK